MSLIYAAEFIGIIDLASGSTDMSVSAASRLDDHN